MPSYDIVIVQRYRVLRDGEPIVGALLHVEAADAEREIAHYKEADARRAATFERSRKARSQAGKWTPHSLRAAMAADPHWEIDDVGGQALGIDAPEGLYKCVWYELDKDEPTHVDGAGRVTPTHASYGAVYIIHCNDQPDRYGTQFELRDPSGEIGRTWTYATVDRLAAALIKRGLIETP